MNNYNIMFRGFVQDNDKDATVANVKQVKDLSPRRHG